MSSNPSVFTRLSAIDVQRLSPTFVRVTLAGPGLAEFGSDQPLYDQRIKLVFVPADQPGTESWEAMTFMEWYALPAEERGQMRTYSIRELTGEGEQRRLVVDVVVHEDGLAGPGAAWALAAEPGSTVWVAGPRRGVQWGGIEFAPPRTDNLLLVGDESAVPAIARILDDLATGPAPEQVRGRVYLEVPDPADIQTLSAPAGVTVGWLPRGHAQVGDRLVPELRAHFGLDAGSWQMAEDADPDLWETPTWSSSGDEIIAAAADGEANNLYAWIAGESRMVTTLRRALVKELGVERAQVAFMGYWRKGVAMKG